MTSGEQLKLVGMETALANTTVGDTDHVERILAAMSYLVTSGREFSSDHVRDRLPADTDAWLRVGSNGNKLGALISRAHRDGFIRRVGWCSPARKERHGNPIGIWIGAHA